MKFSDIKGQETAKRALQVAMVGQHSTMLAANAGQCKTTLINATYTMFPSLMLNRLFECRLTAEYDPNETVLRPHFDQVRNQMLGWPVDLTHHQMLVVLSDLSAADWFLPCPSEPDNVVEERIREPDPTKYLRWKPEPGVKPSRRLPKLLDGSGRVVANIWRGTGKGFYWQIGSVTGGGPRPTRKAAVKDMVAEIHKRSIGLWGCDTVDIPEWTL